MVGHGQALGPTRAASNPTRPARRRRAARGGAAPGRAGPAAGPGLRHTEGGSGHPAISVHEGGCHMAGKHTRGATADQARQVPAACRAAACAHCRPDTPLGVLD
ncbi:MULTISPECIES: DUF6233 domain-containing protein [unclassified Streptomyces]|uniref:DUF6233 domain-containing protein n=1 Tax=unclassified Streptomyces TaxID=2593676 RepID=UPI00340EA664